MWNILRFYADDLAANKINGQTIATGYQYLQVSPVTIEWAFTILSDAPIDNGQIGPDAAVHINNTLIDAQGMH